ncbi:MAG: hypothetical protein ACRDY2_10195 [Acidimicrobiales bacterium]
MSSKRTRLRTVTLTGVTTLALSWLARNRVLDALLGAKDDTTSVPPTGPSPIPPNA